MSSDFYPKLLKQNLIKFYGPIGKTIKMYLLLLRIKHLLQFQIFIYRTFIDIFDKNIGL